MGDFALTYAEIDLPRCSKVYGVTCDAEIGVTGDTKCFNCAESCQDVANYEEEIQVLRLAVNSQHLPSTEIAAFPNIKSLRTSGQRIIPGENLGKRERGTLILENHPSGDEWFDRYILHRLTVDNYVPLLNGTFYGRLAARYPNMKGLTLRIKNGRMVNAADKLAALPVRHYVIDKATYNNRDEFRIDYIDVLTYLEAGKFLFPPPSEGQLDEDITVDNGISFDLKPSGIGNAKYPSSGYAAIGGKEVVSYTRVNDVVTLTGRSLLDTEVRAHKEDDTFQIVAHLTGNSAVIFNDLLEGTDVPAPYYDFTSWETEVLAYNPRIYEAWIAEPTDINKLISDLMQDAGLQIQSDLENQKIKVRPVRKTIPTFSLNNSNCDKIVPKIDDSKLMNAVYTQYGRRNPLLKMDESSNYSGKLIRVDDDPKAALIVNIPEIRKRFSRFIQPTGRQSASDISRLMISRYRKPLRGVEVVTSSDTAPKLGDVGVLNITEFEGLDGRPSTIPVQVVECETDYPDTTLVVEEYGANYLEETDTPRIISVTIDYLNINLRALHDAEWGPSPIPTGKEIIFECDGVARFGSVATSLFSVVMGDWPEIADGVTLKIRNAKGYGRGGNGGTVGHPVGHKGGVCFYTRVPVTLELCTFGSGGGGGGGSMVAEVGPSYGIWYDGNGGAGFQPGTGYSTTGGTGGGYGASGNAGGGGPLTHHPGGPAGDSAIDGVSYCTKISCTIFGAEIN